MEGANMRKIYCYKEYPTLEEDLKKSPEQLKEEIKKLEEENKKLKECPKVE